jgi:hypothetical protein
MIALEQLTTTQAYQFRCDVDLYNSCEAEELATQGAGDRQFHILGSPQNNALPILLSEDDYACWLSLNDLDKIDLALAPYQPRPITRSEIEKRIDAIIAYTQHAMNQPNHYLWGGTVPPNYDCSGLMQAAFASVGIWIPRDSYQQHNFTQPISIEEAQPGDLLFFSSGKRITHVALYLGDLKYIHSSGKDRGRNGIGIDTLSAQGDAFSQYYHQLYCGAGRISAGYISTGNPDAQFESPTPN